MAAISTKNYEWIAHRLPTGLDATDTFTKNGVTKTLRQTVDEAWGDHADRADADPGRRMLALADVLEILASDDRFQDTTQGPFRGVGPLLLERATYWRRQAGNAASVPAGTLSGAATTFNGRCNEYGGGVGRDEFAS